MTFEGASKAQLLKIEFYSPDGKRHSFYDNQQKVAQVKNEKKPGESNFGIATLSPQHWDVEHVRAYPSWRNDE